MSSAGKQAAVSECRGIAVDDAGDRFDPGFSRRASGATAWEAAIASAMASTRSRIERTGFRQMIDGLALVEAGHFNRKFDRRALSVDARAIHRRFA